MKREREIEEPSWEVLKGVVDVFVGLKGERDCVLVYAT